MRTRVRRPTAGDGRVGIHHSGNGAAADPQQTIGLLVQLREDWEVHDRSWTRPGLHAVAVHRLGRWARTVPGPWRRVVGLLHGMLYFVVRNLYGIELPTDATIGRRLRISHQSGLVVNAASTIGDDCLLRHNVTLGAVSRDRADEAPTLCDDVQVGPGAVIMGPITIGSGSRIGPNAVVVTDVPPGGRVVAPAATLRGVKLP